MFSMQSVLGKILRQKCLFLLQIKQIMWIMQRMALRREKRARMLGKTVLRNELDLIASVLSKQVYR